MSEDPFKYDEETGHLVECLEVAGIGTDPDCKGCDPSSDGEPEK